MNIIALADNNWAIGNNGRLLVDIPEDKKLFRGETYGKVLWEVPKKMAHQPPKIQTVLIKNKAWTSQRK